MKVAILLLASATLAFGECPIGKIEVMRDWLFNEPAIDHHLPVVVKLKYTNTTSKTIVGTKFRAIWRDVTDDYHATFIAWSSDGVVKPGATRKEQWMTPIESWAGTGWIVAPYRILYSDGTYWQISPSGGLCFGQTLSRSTPPLKEAPTQLLR